MTALSAREVYERQDALALARADERQVFDDLWYDTPVQARDTTKLLDHPDVQAAKARTAALEAEVADAQAEVGGKVYRVAAENVTTLQAKLAKLNKRAAKLGVDAITLTVTDEVDEQVAKEDGVERIYTWRFAVLDGKAPMVPGFAFIAALDLTVQDDKNDPVTINRVPAFAYQLQRTEGLTADEAQERLASIDLTAYRRAKNVCEQCGFARKRNTLYVVYELATGKTKQVGSDCLRDFTGANDPERIARWAEWLASFDRDLELAGTSEGGGGRLAVATRNYLANVAAVIRESGWTPRWRTDDWGESYRQFGTADAAWSNMNPRTKQEREEAVAVTEEDDQTAEAALEWARSLADKDDDELSEFESNLVAVTRGDFMPEKGDGLVAYVVRGLQREQEKEVERAATADIEAAAVPATDERLTIEGTVLSGPTWKDSDYGGGFKMLVLDDRGFKVWGTCPDVLVEWDTQVTKPGDERVDRELQGQRVRFCAKVKPSGGDFDFGYFSRPTKAEVIEDA